MIWTVRLVLPSFSRNQYSIDCIQNVRMRSKKLYPSKHVSRQMIWIYRKRTKILSGMKWRWCRYDKSGVSIGDNQRFSFLFLLFVDRLQYSGFGKIQWAISWCCWNQCSWHKENIGFGNGNKTFESELSLPILFLFLMKRHFYCHIYTIDFFVNIILVFFLLTSKHIKTYKVSYSILSSALTNSRTHICALLNTKILHSFFKH